jgi:uncharacterized tellurite resistance protein B-like protein
MFVASGRTPGTDDASPGLYAQAILGISEDGCLEAKQAERIGVMTLVDCLGTVQRLPREDREKIVTGVLMIAYADRRMHTLEVRWASMLASAAGLSPEDFQHCCASARVIAAMLRPQKEDVQA